MSEDICIDNRFEIIDKAKRLLTERTNITDAPDEMKVLYSILYRCWQMGWLDRLDGTIADMLDANAKLVMKLNAEHLVRQNVERENANLRELVRDMLACINNVSAHDTYCWDYCDFCKMYTTKGRCDFESRMRELGVDA